MFFAKSSIRDLFILYFSFLVGKAIVRKIISEEINSIHLWGGTFPFETVEKTA